MLGLFLEATISDYFIGLGYTKYIDFRCMFKPREKSYTNLKRRNCICDNWVCIM